MNRLTTGSAAILATLTLGFNLGLARAEPSSRVSTRGLDLRNPQDIATLYARISVRARIVCREASSSWDVGRGEFISKCAAGAIDAAVAQARIEALTALHQSRKAESSKVAYNAGE